MKLSRQRLSRVAGALSGRLFEFSDIVGLTIDWDFSDLETLFKDVAATTPVTTDAEAIAYVGDKALATNHGKNTEATRRPLWKANIQNGLGVARFDGSNDFLENVTITRNQPRTVFIVMKQLSWTTSDAIFTSGAAGGDIQEIMQGYGMASPGLAMYAGAQFVKYFNPGTTKFNVLWFVFNGANSYMGMNDGVYVTGNGGTQNGTALRLGALSVAGGQAANIDVGRVLDYDSALSLEDIAKVVHKLNQQWSCFTPATEYDIPATYQSYFRAPLHTEAGLEGLQAWMRSTIWPGGYPTAGMDTTTLGIVDPLTVSPTNLSSVDSHTITQTDPNTTLTINPIRTIHVWHPTSPNGAFVIFHKGHSDTWNEIGMNTTIKELVEAGYTVGGVTMPMEPDDTWTLHSGVMYNINDATDLQWFLDTAIRVINEYIGTFSTFYMTGISGGGWTTAVLAAIEPRITKGLDVAGSLPFMCHAARSDTEQKLFTLGLDYSDLYTMACTANRKFKQILITNDPVTFTLAMYNNKPYEVAVQAFKPNYSLDWDSTTAAHEISAATRQAILDFFAA